MGLPRVHNRSRWGRATLEINGAEGPQTVGQAPREPVGLGLIKNFFTGRVVKHWNRLSREGQNHCSWKCSKIADVVLRDMG